MSTRKAVTPKPPSLFWQRRPYEVSVNIDNLFDKLYFTPDADTYAALGALPGIGRVWRVVEPQVQNFGTSLKDNFTAVDKFNQFTGGVATVFSRTFGMDMVNPAPALDPA